MTLLLRTPLGLRPPYVLNKNLKENENRKKLMNIFEKEIMVIRGCSLSRNTLYTFAGIRNYSKRQYLSQFGGKAMPPNGPPVKLVSVAE